MSIGIGSLATSYNASRKNDSIQTIKEEHSIVKRNATVENDLTAIPNTWLKMA